MAMAMAMLRWRIAIQKLTAPAPRQWAGSASSSLSPLPPLFFCHNLPPTFPPFSFATQLPSTVAHYSGAPEPNQTRHRSQVANMREEEQEQEYVGGFPVKCFPLIMRWKERSSEEIRERCRAVSLEMKYAEETLDHFYREMSKEVETILHEGDPRLPEELSRRVVVTCVSEDPPWRYYDPRENWTYVYVLRRKQRKRGSGASAAKSAAKESCRELEVELYMTYSPELEVAAALWPSDDFPFGKDRMLHKWKVVNKFELSSQDVDEYGVAREEAKKCAGWLIAQNKLAGKDTRTLAMELWEKSKLIVVVALGLDRPVLLPTKCGSERESDLSNPNLSGMLMCLTTLPNKSIFMVGFHENQCEVANMREEEQEQEYVGGFPVKCFPLIMRWKERSSEEIRERCRAVSLEMKYAEETLDHFYREMSKEVETILHEGDPRLPEELSRRVVVTCVSEDPPWRYYDPRDNWTYVYVLRRKQRKQGSGASAAKSAAKESCRELELELYMTYSPELEVAAALWPSDDFPFGKDRMLHKWKVVNKFVLSSQDEDVYAVAEEEARKWAGWLIAQNKLAGKDMGKDTSNATLGKV